jgi:hypothetical protein
MKKLIYLLFVLLIISCEKDIIDINTLENDSINIENKFIEFNDTCKIWIAANPETKGRLSDKASIIIRENYSEINNFEFSNDTVIYLNIIPEIDYEILYIGVDKEEGNIYFGFEFNNKKYYNIKRELYFDKKCSLIISYDNEKLIFY